MLGYFWVEIKVLCLLIGQLRKELDTSGKWFHIKIHIKDPYKDFFRHYESHMPCKQIKCKLFSWIYETLGLLLWNKSYLFARDKNNKEKINQQEFCLLSLKKNYFLSLKAIWKCSQGKEFAASPRYKHSLQDKQRKLFHHKSVSHQNSPFRPLQRPSLLMALLLQLFLFLSSRRRNI